MTGMLSVGLAVLIGWLLVRSAGARVGLKPRWAVWLFEVALGVGSGIGLTSAVYFLLLVGQIASPAAIYITDSLLLLVAAGLLWRRRQAKPAVEASGVEPAAGFRWNWVLGLALLLGWLAVSSALVEVAQANPHGAWDAWSIWNLRAKFLAGPGKTWENAVSPLLGRTHPDYPLLLSGFVARVWKASSDTGTLVPVVTGFLFAGSAVGLLFGALALLRGVSSALLAGLVMLAGTTYLVESTTQYADVPLSFYYLATLALVLLGDTSAPGARGRILAMAGACASCAAWTKNEGMIFLALSLGCYFLMEWRASGLKEAFERWRFLVLGALPGLLLVVWFKFFLAPPTDPLLRQTALKAAQKLGDLGRYAQIGKALLAEAVNFGGGVTHPLLLLAILGFALRFRAEERYKRPVLYSSVTLALVFASYLAVYLITPSDLAWHLGTSLGRLCCQLWPGFLLVAFMVLGRLEDATVVEARVAGRRAVRAKRKERGGRN